MFPLTPKKSSIQPETRQDKFKIVRKKTKKRLF